MSFWPADTAGQAADVLAFATAAAAAWSGVIASIRGSAADKAAKAADQAIRELKREYHRGSLLRAAADQYQKMYRELAPVLSQQTDPLTVSQKLGELRGMANGLDTYLYDNEKGTLKLLLVRLDLIDKEPTAPSHFQVLLRHTATLSVELDTIVKKELWNRQF